MSVGSNECGLSGASGTLPPLQRGSQPTHAHAHAHTPHAALDALDPRPAPFIEYKAGGRAHTPSPVAPPVGRHQLKSARQLHLLESITVRVKHGPFTRCLVFESTSTNQLFATGKVGGFSSTFLELPHCLAVHVLVSFHVLRGPCLTRTVILLGELRRGQTSLTSCDRYLSLTEEVEMLLSVITSPPECCRIPCRSVM